VNGLLRETRVRLALAYAAVFTIVMLFAAAAIWVAAAIILNPGRTSAVSVPSIVFALVAGLMLLIVAAVVVGYGLAGTALRPVREITSMARTFSEHDLHQRIELDLPPDELGQLAATFNQMLGRLEVAFDALGRFTADASHELRAPLTLIRTEAEVALSRARSPEEYRQSLETILAEAERLGRLADQLLMLARVDAGSLAVSMQPVGVPALLEETVARWTPLAEQRGVVLSALPAARGEVRADRDLLGRLLDNLVDNALRHTPGGGTIQLSAVQGGPTWVIAVKDDGPGVDPAVQPILFERFARGDPARGRETGGVGLGLALCAAIAKVHQGTLTLEESPDPGATFVLQLPAFVEPEGQQVEGLPAPAAIG
jgi:heavy metal sensor kinase